MLEIHPLSGENLKEYIAANGLADESAVLMANENGGETGSLSMTIEGLAQNAVATIHTLQANDVFTEELLIRAAASYAFNRAVPKVAAPKSLHDPVFEKIGFKIDEQITSINTEKVVHLCKK